MLVWERWLIGSLNPNFIIIIYLFFLKRLISELKPTTCCHRTNTIPLVFILILLLLQLVLLFSVLLDQILKKIIYITLDLMNIMPHITRQFCFMHLSNIINSLIYIYIITNIRNWSFWKRGKIFFFFFGGGGWGGVR